VEFPGNLIYKVKPPETVIPGTDYQCAPLAHGRVLPAADIIWSGFAATGRPSGAKWLA
jgi:hypothetical protein